MSTPDDTPPVEKKALISIREKIQHFKFPITKGKPLNIDNETSKLFNRRLSVIPANIKRSKLLARQSASVLDITAMTKNATLNESITSSQSDNSMGSQSQVEVPASSMKLQISSVESLSTSTPTTTNNQQRGKRISFNDDRNDSNMDLVVPTPDEPKDTATPANNDSVFKAPLTVTGPKILKLQARKPNDNQTPSAGGKKLCVEHPNQGKNLVGYKVTIPKRLPVQIYCNKNDGSAFMYGFARNVAFAVVLCDNQRKNIFKCHIPSCTYQLMDETLMKKHIESCHRGQNWNGYCAKCSKLFFFPEKENTAVTMLDEFNHVREIHMGCAVEKTVNASTSTPVQASGKNLAGFQHSPSVAPAPNNNIQFRNRALTHTPRPCKDPRINRNLHENPSEVTSEQFYNSIDTINLRPWFNESPDLKKTKAAALAMLHEDPLTAFYKCMHKNCAYFTCDVENFRRHMTMHKSVNNLCCYCPFNSASVENLMKHMHDEHNFDCFQCGFCFYRCYSEGNLITHAKRYHDNKASIVIIEISRRGYRENKDRLYMEARSYESFSKFVSKFECPCGSKFYLFNDFEKHIKEHGNRELYFNCKECHRPIPLKELIEHNEKCLKQSCIQCIHCHYGCQNSYKIFEHLTNQHGSKVPMYCDRIESSSNHDPNSFKCLNLKIVEHKPTDNIIILRKLDTTPALRNTSNVEIINYHVSREEPADEGANSEPLLELSESFLTNTVSSIFSDPGDLAETLAVLDTIDSSDIATMFN